MRKFYSNFVGGANTALSPFLMPENSTYTQVGVVTSYKIGAALKRLGYQRVGDVAESSKSITGLFDFTQVPGTQKILQTVNDSSDDDTQLFYNNAGTWTEIAAAETAWANKADINVEMESFIEYCFFVGHGDTDGFLPVGSLTGTTFSTSDRVTNMPQGKFIVRYRDRLYVLNTRESGTNYPFRTYFSSVPTAGDISWTVADDFFDIDYSDEITGAGVNWDLLIIFTKRKAYYYNQNAKKKLWDTGCDAHRTIKNSGINMIWANRDGVWLSQNGGQPQNVAGPVIDFIRNGTSTSFKAEVIEEQYHLYVGTVTVNGVTYSNTRLVFDIPTASWRWDELAHNMTIFETYDDSGEDRLYMGGTAGNIWNQSKYVDATLIGSDGDVAGTAGSDIHASFETRQDPIDDPMVVKKLRKVTIFSERARNVKVQVKTVDSNTRGVQKYLPLGALEKYVNVFEGLDMNFNLLQFQFTEYSTLPYFSVFGMEIEYDLVGEKANTK